MGFYMNNDDSSSNDSSNNNPMEQVIVSELPTQERRDEKNLRINGGNQHGRK